MKERPIPFSGLMVRAILDGIKTQTRRPIKPQPVCWNYLQPMWGTSPDGFEFGERYLWREVGPDYPDDEKDDRRCPYGVPGNRLWVKETFWVDRREPNECVIYAASPGRHKYQSRGVVEPCDARLTEDYLEKHKFWYKRPSIFMPRWASRITLEITNVRVERVQEISESDCQAEGVEHNGLVGYYCEEDDSDEFGGTHRCNWRAGYALLWDSINAGNGHTWDSNPWVWCVTFRRIKS